VNDQRDKARGALLGLAVGDALGAPYEFQHRDTFKCKDMVAGGPFNLKKGQWTDDTSMALCLAESLLEHPGFNAYDCMSRFVRWREEGYNASTGRCFDIGSGTSHAIDNFIQAPMEQRKSLTAWGDINAAGNGCIMRMAPVPIMWHRDLGKMMTVVLDQCSLTHGALAARNASFILATEIAKQLSRPFFNFKEGWRHIAAKPRSEIKSDGYAPHTLKAAIWAVATTDNFRDALLAAVNLGEDSDTTGAVAGQLAGAIYGVSEIPTEWLVQDWQRILKIADQLYDKFVLS
jgi:ADP-ribosyl-[dinitrogen reductase] hydrolase